MTLPLHVLHITAGNLYGGVENTLTVLARQIQWDQRLERTYAICFPGRLTEELIRAGVPTTVLGPVRARYPWQVLQRRQQLAALFAQEEFDAVICHMAWSLALFGPVIRSAGLPLLFWMHDVAQGTHWVERWARLTTPDLTIVNSQFTAKSLSKLFPQTSPHVVIHGPSERPCSEPDAAIRVELRRELTTSIDDVVIVQIGRMEPYKGHSLHFQALAQLVDLPSWTCWVAGGVQRPHEQAYLNELKAQAVRAGIAGRVRFLGERKDVGQLLGAADIFCQPNLRGEPFGLVFVEALYAGLPVVGTAIGGVLEIVDDSCGKLAPPDDPVALAKVLRELIVNPELRASLGRNGPARAESISHPDLIMGQLETALIELIEHRRRHDLPE